MTLTQARVIQYVFILTVLILIAMGGWWYYKQSEASTALQRSQLSLTSGLQGYWPMDGNAFSWDDTTTEVKDMSGNSRHINLGISGDAPELVSGRRGQGLRFPIAASVTGTLPNSFNSYTTGTIAMWIRYSGTLGEVATSGTLFGYEDCGNNHGQFQLAMDPQNSQMYLWMTASGAGCTATVDATTALPDPTGWHFVVFTDDTAGHKLYIDGVQQVLTYTSGSAATDFFFDNITGSSLTPQIGTMNNENFSGTIDEFRLYNRALSADEVNHLYDLGQVTVNTRPGDDVLEESLSGYWTLDENTGINAADATGNGNAGTLTNGPTWTTGRIGTGVDLDGTDDYITVADSDTLDFGDGDAFTLSGWFNRDTFTTDDTILAKSNGQTAADTGYAVYIDDTTDKVTVVVNDGTDQYTLESVSTVTATGWHHVALVWNDVGSSATQLYMDGSPQQTATGTFANVNALANALAFRIGAESDNGNPFDGKVDEARVYHRALSADEVRRLYQETHPDDPDTGLVGHWTFDGMDTSGTVAKDRGRGGNDGTLTNGPTKSIGKLGQALDIDGADDFVNIGSPAVLDDIATLSVCAWINPRTAGEIFSGSDRWGGIASKGYPGWFYMTTNVFGSVRPYLYRHFSGNGGSWYPTSDTIPLNEWTHVCVTYDDTSTSNDPVFYLNGSSVTVTEENAPTGTADSEASSDLHIGTNDVTDQVFDGKIDEVRVYNRILSTGEVSALYNMGR